MISERDHDRIFARWRATGITTHDSAASRSVRFEREALLASVGLDKGGAEAETLRLTYRNDGDAVVSIAREAFEVGYRVAALRGCRRP